MIIINNIHKSYGEKTNKVEVLKGIDLRVEDGDFLVVLGPSGSGKSTLLNIVSGLEKPDKGSVSYDDTKITALNDKELTEFRKKSIGFVFQQYYLLQNLNVDKNIRMGADLVSNKSYGDIVKAMGLEKLQGKYPSELSGGEQQRVSIARALAKKPRVLFLDEPTGALDEETGRLVLDYISKLQTQEKFTIVMITHNENIAEMAKTIIRINSGRIVETKDNKRQKTAYEIGW